MSKNIIITGGSRGIGRVLVEGLAMQGNNVVFTYNKSKKEASQIEKTLTDKGYNVKAYKVDGTNLEEIKQFTDLMKKEFKLVDVFINNAGVSQNKLFTDITEKDWEYIINTNLRAAVFLSREISKKMISSKKGLIINISSVWGMVGASCEVLYSISKAGIDGLTKSLAKELAPSGIRVNSIAPGMIRTTMNDNLTEEEKREINAQIPLGVAGAPEEILKCVNWLLEDSYTTGQIISVNGGWVI